MNETDQHIAIATAEALNAGEVIAWLSRAFAVIGILGAPAEIDRHALVALLLSWLISEWLYERLQSTQHGLLQTSLALFAAGPVISPSAAIELQVSRALHLLQWQTLATGVTLSCLIVFGFNNQ